MAIPDQLIEEIQNKTDIVEVISPYVALKKTGRNHKGLCPFHSEKTPSFIVSQDKQIFHCFGCGAGGNVFGFLMRQERMEFIEAVKLLAQSAGVKLPSASAKDRELSSLAAKILEVNSLACEFYQSNLSGNKEALDYLRSRGVSDESIKLLRLGFAPFAWDSLLNFLSKKGVASDLIEKAGLSISNERGGYYDRFRNRMIFPISDLRNRIIGFGGRVLDSSLPKYVNSPETAIYSKGKNLYGLNFSKDEIKRKNYAIMVEGYMDFIIPFQAGACNVVATLGTALTRDQASLLKRFARTCVVVYDPDDAGQTASLRNLDIFINEGISVYIATLTKGYDPDSFIRKFGLEEFNSLLKQAKNLFDYKLELVTARFNPKDIHGKVAIAAEMLPTIAKIENAILQSGLVKKLAAALLVDEESLRAELKKVRPDYSAIASRKGAAPKAKKKGAVCDAEKMLLALMLEDAHYIKRAKDILKPEEFRDRNMVDVARALFDSDPEEKRISAATLLNRFKENEASTDLISEAAAMNEVISDRDRVFVDCVEVIKKDNIKSELESLKELISAAHTAKDEKSLKELVERYNELIKTKKT